MENFQQFLVREHAEDQRDGACWGDWLEENIVKPAYQAGVVQPFNLGVNAANLVAGAGTFSRLPDVEMLPAASTGGELTRAVSSGVAGLWPYLIGGKVTSLGLRAAGRQMMAEGLTARVLANEATGLVLTAAAVDGLRDLHEGETRLSSLAGGIAGFGVFGVGNNISRRWSLAERALLANPLIGALGGEMQLRVNAMVSGRQFSEEERMMAWTSGAASNFVLPWAQEGLSRGIDRLSLKWSRSLSADRYAQYNNMLGQSPDLDRQLGRYPLTRVEVQTGGKGSRIDLHNGRVILDPALSSVAAQDGISQSLYARDLGHELAHRGLVRTAAAKFDQAAQLLPSDSSSAEQLFLSTRRWQELEARRVGLQIARDFEARAGAPAHSDSPLIATDVLPPSYEQRFALEWQQFKQSDGKTRPRVEFNQPAEGTGLIVIDSGFSLDAIRKAGQVLGVYDLVTGRSVEGAPVVSDTALRSFSGDALNHGSIVLAGDGKFLGLSDRLPGAPVVLVRAFGDNNSLIRTQWRDGSIESNGWTEAYRWSVDLLRKRELSSVANCSFGGYTHAMDGGGWESFQLGKETGAGKPGHVVVAAAGPGDGKPVHASWLQNPGEHKIVDAYQSGTTRYNFWGDKPPAVASGGGESRDFSAWRLSVLRDGWTLHEFDGTRIMSNLWNGRKQINFIVEGEGPVQLKLTRDGSAGGSDAAAQRFDCWVATASARFNNEVSPVYLPEPAVFPHVVAVGLKEGRYAPDQAVAGAKPDVLWSGEGPISFRTPEVTAMVARLLSGAGGKADVSAVRSSLGKYPF